MKVDFVLGHYPGIRSTSFQAYDCHDCSALQGRDACFMKRPEIKGRAHQRRRGKLDPSARGVNEEEHVPAAKLGVTKVNIDTDGRLVWTRVHREYFRWHPEQFDFK